MDINVIRNISEQSEDFKAELKSKLEEAILNHPKVQESAKLSKIYEEIKELNSRISKLLAEANAIKSKSEPVNEEMSLKDTGVDKSYENVEYVAIHDMDLAPKEVLDNKELPSKPSKLGGDWVAKVFDSKIEVQDLRNREKLPDNEF